MTNILYHTHKTGSWYLLKHFKPHPQNRILVPLRGEKHFKPHPQNRILVPLRGDKHFKLHPQNRILILLRGDKQFKPGPENRILVPLMGSFQISNKHPRSFHMRVTPQGWGLRLLLVYLWIEYSITAAQMDFSLKGSNYKHAIHLLNCLILRTAFMNCILLEYWLSLISSFASVL